MNLKQSSITPVLVFLFALGVRLFYLLEFQDNPYFDYIPSGWDQFWYDQAAREFAAGDYFLIHSPQPSQFSYFYKFFLGIVYWLVDGNFFLIWSAQFLFGALASILVYWISMRLFDWRVALTSALLFAMYGPEIFYEGVLYRESLVTFFSLLSCYALILYAERQNKKRLAFAGLSFAFLILCRPNMILMGPFIYAFLFSVERKNGCGYCKPMLFFTLAVFLTLLPLSLHMVYMQKHFVFLDASGPRTLLLGNLPEYPGKEWLPQYYLPYAKQVGGEPKSYIGVIQYLASKIAENPPGFVGLYARKIFYFFNNYEVPSSMNYYLMKDFSRVLSSPLSNFLIYGTLGLVGMVLLIGQWERFQILYYFSAGIFISVCLFYITARFRIPIVPFLMMFSSYAIFYFADRAKKLSARKILGVTVCLSALAYSLTCTKDLRSVPIRPIDYANLGSAYELNSRFYNQEKAQDLYIKAWNASASLGSSENQIAHYLAPFLLRQAIAIYQRGDYSNAIREFERSAAIIYEHGETHTKLALAFKNIGRLAEAIYHAEESLLVEPEKPAVHLLLVQLYTSQGDYFKARFHGRKTVALIKDEQKKNSLSATLQPMENLTQYSSQGSYFEIDHARALVQNGKVELAEDILKKNFGAHSDVPEIYLLIGDIFSIKNELAKSLSAYRQALILGYEDFDLLVRMGELARGLGMDQVAAMYYRKALKYSPGQIEIKAVLEQLEGRHATTPYFQLIGSI